MAKRKRIPIAVKTLSKVKAKVKAKKQAKKPEKKKRDSGIYFDDAETVSFFTSGCAGLDCAISQGHGWAERIINIVGDKSTGKTLLACEAAANYLRKYPDAKVWYRETEAAFDNVYIEALGIPVQQFDRSGEFYNIEDVFEELRKLVVGKQQGLYIVDSLDALGVRAEMDVDLDKGTFGTKKAARMSQLFKELNQKIAKAKITVLVVSQVRDNIGVMFGEKHTRSGGKALDFYASQVVWLSQIKQLHRTVNKVKRAVGVQIKAKVKKCKVGLPFREFEFPILFNYGVENVVSGVDWLEEVDGLEAAGIDKEDAKYLTDLATISNMDRAEYQRWGKIVTRGVKKVWRTIERSFAINRTKY